MKSLGKPPLERGLETTTGTLVGSGSLELNGKGGGTPKTVKKKKQSKGKERDLSQDATQNFKKGPNVGKGLPDTYLLGEGEECLGEPSLRGKKRVHGGI